MLLLTIVPVGATFLWPVQPSFWNLFPWIVLDTCFIALYLGIRRDLQPAVVLCLGLCTVPLMLCAFIFAIDDPRVAPLAMYLNLFWNFAMTLRICDLVFQKVLPVLPDFDPFPLSEPIPHRAPSRAVVVVVVALPKPLDLKTVIVHV